jgi:hypothetical protein
MSKQFRKMVTGISAGWTDAETLSLLGEAKEQAMGIQSKLSDVKIEKRQPLWAGPEDRGPNGGVTQSLISRWLCCRERFRVRFIEGLQPADSFNHRTSYGNMWHVCEEAYSRHGSKKSLMIGSDPVWIGLLKKYVQGLCQRYPFFQEQVQHWYEVCKAQFPIYVDYWAKHAEQVKRTPLLQEQVFDVPYKLPSGRTVRLRGKWDGVELVQEACNCGGGAKDGHRLDCRMGRKGIWLVEHKTKGDIDPELIQRQLTWDLQVMTYLVALHEKPSCDLPRRGHYRNSDGKEYPILGVRYNVVRRPLSGGKGTIVQHKGSKNVPAETKVEFYGRMAQYIKDEPEHYFMRWSCRVSHQDIERFRRQCLDPILEQMCLWYDCMVRTEMGNVAMIPVAAASWRHPYGVVNNIDEYGWGDVDFFMNTGSEAGLHRVEKLFTELE